MQITKKNPDCIRVQRDRFIFKLSKLYISKIDIWHTLFYSNIEIHVWQPNSKWWITKKKLLNKKKWHTLDEIRNAADKIQNV